MTTIEALQNLYTTLGGEASEVADINTIPAMIDAINTVAGGSSSGGENNVITVSLNSSASEVTGLRLNGETITASDLVDFVNENYTTLNSTIIFAKVGTQGSGYNMVVPISFAGGAPTSRTIRIVGILSNNYLLNISITSAGSTINNYAAITTT